MSCVVRPTCVTCVHARIRETVHKLRAVSSQWPLLFIIINCDLHTHHQYSGRHAADSGKALKHNRAASGGQTERSYGGGFGVRIKINIGESVGRVLCVFISTKHMKTTKHYALVYTTQIQRI